MDDYKRPFFGKPWDAPICEDIEIVPTPVGEICIMCEEPIEEGDRGWYTTYVSVDRMARRGVEHAECQMRGILGSVGHQRRQCSCFGGVGNGDPEGVSRHEAARLAWKEAGMPA